MCVIIRFPAIDSDVIVIAVLRMTHADTTNRIGRDDDYGQSTKYKLSDFFETVAAAN